MYRYSNGQISLYEQQKYMYDHRTHKVPDRIVSVSQPFVRPIVRGKARKPVEFGVKLDISVVDGWTRLEYHSFDAYNEAKNLQDMVERFCQREDIIPAVSWQTKSVGIGRISGTAKRMEFGCPVLRWAGPKRRKSETKRRITVMNANVWK